MSETEPDPELCEWFALCDHPAVGHMDHPAIGSVPICARCMRWYEDMGG